MDLAFALCLQWFSTFFYLNFLSSTEPGKHYTLSKCLSLWGSHYAIWFRRVLENEGRATKNLKNDLLEQNDDLRISFANRNVHVFSLGNKK